jgi:hypothetical protein
MADQAKHRFIAFISRRDEMAEYRSLRPCSDFVFASFSHLGPDVVQVDPQRPSVMIDAFLCQHSQAPFTAVLNRKEKCVIPASQLALALGLPPLTLKPEVARDKFLMRMLLNDGHFFPGTVLIRAADDLADVESSMFPGVLKPRFGFNSRSAVLVNDRHQLMEAYWEQHQLYASLPKQDGTNSDFVFEQLIPGMEYSVETLVKNGCPVFHLISDKAQMTAPYFVEIGDTMPSLLGHKEQAACVAASERALQRMEIRHGWTHTEVKLDGGSAIVVECAARMGGGYFERLFEEVYGIQRMQILMDMYCGEPLPGMPVAKTHAAARRVVVYGPKRHWHLANAAELFGPDHVLLLWPESTADISRELAGPPDDFNNTLCEFAVLAGSAEEAVKHADELLRRAHENLGVI